MRLSYYRFPDGTPESVLLSNGCEVVFKDGSSNPLHARDARGNCLYDENDNPIYLTAIPEVMREYVSDINPVLFGTVTYVKRMIKQYGGHGWTEHIDRDGGLFETSEITLKGNNSRFKYNHHL